MIVFKIKNKKGFLLAEETLKIVIALIAISFLVYFLSSLYFNSQNEKKLEFAKASLKHLVEEMNSMGEDKPKDVEIYNPKGWSISSWPFENTFPEQCSNFEGNRCICICKEPWVDFNSNYLGNCNDKSICMNNPNNFVVKRVGTSQLPINIEKVPIILKIENKIIQLK